MSYARYAYQDIDPLLHAPSRLGIVTALYADGAGLSFVELRELCQLSDGNLSRHLQKLEADGVLHTTKSFVGRVPQTKVTMTTAGRARFERYLEQLRTIVEQGVCTASGAPVEDAL